MKRQCRPCKLTHAIKGCKRRVSTPRRAASLYTLLALWGSEEPSSSEIWCHSARAVNIKKKSAPPSGHT
ncbi:hypothetical protein ABBQ38_004587 [Trebouxia sp. C0009 RCD-2024]